MRYVAIGKPSKIPLLNDVEEIESMEYYSPGLLKKILSATRPDAIVVAKELSEKQWKSLLSIAKKYNVPVLVVPIAP